MDFVQRQREMRDHDAWFRAKVQEALDDPRPSIPNGVVMDDLCAIIERIAAEKTKA